MNIRPATVHDAEGIATAHIRSWQAAYARLLPAEFLASLSIEQRAQRWTNILQAEESNTLVADLKGTVKAFISFGHCRDEAAPSGRAEIWALYAAPDAWGQGLGRALIERATGSLRERAFHETSLWVLSGNTRGVRFYSAAGFELVSGSQKLFTLGGVQLEEVQLLLHHAA